MDPIGGNFMPNFYDQVATLPDPDSYRDGIRGALKIKC